MFLQIIFNDLMPVIKDRWQVIFKPAINLLH